MTIHDPEDQAERRHLEIRLHHLIVWITRSVCKLGRKNIPIRTAAPEGGQNLARAASARTATSEMHFVSH